MMAPSTSKLLFFQLSTLAESATFTIMSLKFPDLTYMLGAHALLKITTVAT